MALARVPAHRRLQPGSSNNRVGRLRSTSRRPAVLARRTDRVARQLKWLRSVVPQAEPVSVPLPELR